MTQHRATAHEGLWRAKGAGLGDDRQVAPTLRYAQRYPWLDLANQPDACGAGAIKQSASGLAARAEQPAKGWSPRHDELCERAAQKRALAEIDPFAEAGDCNHGQAERDTEQPSLDYLVQIERAA